MIDSEGSTRTVLLTINLHENADTFKRVLVSWHLAFGCSLPRVIMTNGEEGIFAAIASIPYSHEMVHLLCTFHLFDQNVKKKIRTSSQQRLELQPGGYFGNL